MASKHIHIHFDDALHVHPNFKEEQHPRAKGGRTGGQFVRGSGGQGSSGPNKLTLKGGPKGARTARPVRTPTPRPSVGRMAANIGKAAGHAVVAGAQGAKRTFGSKEGFKEWASKFGQHDLEIMHSRMHKVGSKERQTKARQIYNLARSLPQIAKNWGVHEKQKAVGAYQALRSIAMGQPPTAEHRRALRQFATSIALTAAGTVVFGDPTGHATAAAVHGTTAAAHGMSVLMQEFITHASEHALGERGLGTAIGGLRLAYHKLTGSPVHVHVHDESGDGIDYAVLQKFLVHLAKTIETHEISDERMKQLLAQAQQQLRNGTN